MGYLLTTAWIDRGVGVLDRGQSGDVMVEGVSWL